MLSKEEIEKAWQLLGGRGFDSLCAFADDYAIKLLEDHEYLIGEVERLTFDHANALSLRNVAVKHFNEMEKENKELHKAIKTLNDYVFANHDIPLAARTRMQKIIHYDLPVALEGDETK